MYKFLKRPLLYATSGVLAVTAALSPVFLHASTRNQVPAPTSTLGPASDFVAGAWPSGQGANDTLVQPVSLTVPTAQHAPSHPQVSQADSVQSHIQATQHAAHAHHSGSVSHLRPAHKVTHSAGTSNLYWLAKAIEAEAGAEPQATKIAVGDVIINRVHSPLYPNSVHGVIFQIANGHYAFTSVANGWIYHQPSPASLAAARAVLYNDKNIVPGALVFYNSAHTPAQSWVRTRPTIRVIGDMTFSR